MESVNVRNLEQIQEQDGRLRPGRLGTFLLLGVAGAALAVAGVMGAQKTSPAARSEQDPLAELVARSKLTEASPEKLEGKEVTFPSILSDRDKPTTALAAVKDERGRLVTQEPAAPVLGSDGLPKGPPPATDRLPIAPLPAGTLLAATPVTTQPKDRLTALAAQRADGNAAGGMAPPGSDGGFQIQVASFKNQADADGFVDELRRRGHRAFRLSADVGGRGLWHRVRVGPFKNKYEANEYKKQFEKTERVSPFVVDPARARESETRRAPGRSAPLGE
jgi:cell division septation protein DedD